MKMFLLWTFLLSGITLKAQAEPDAVPGPSPVADPGRKPSSAIKPVITREPMDLIAIRSRTARLECSAEGYPFPQITWLKDGKPFENSPNRFLIPNGEIMFNRVRSNVDEGTYQCIAKNSAGVARSRNATIRVAYIKDDFRTIPEDRAVAVGETAELRCEGPKGLPEPKISWEKDNRDISSGDRRIRIEKGKLFISGATKADSGSYQCIASNIAGRRESVRVRLFVNERPEFTIKPEDKTVAAGEELELACEARGDPKPRIKWTKPDGVQNSRVVSLSNGNLRIENVQAGDEGTYVCTAENRVSEISASAVVTVNSKPEFVRHPGDVTARVGTSVTLPCSARGKPHPTILWHASDGGKNMFPDHDYKDGHIVVDSDGDLTIYNVRFSDQGLYTCEAYSAAGVINADAKLTVMSRQSNINPPVIRQGPPNMTVAHGSTVDLRCTTSAVPVPDLRWTKSGSGDIRSGNRFTVTTSGSLKISNVQSNDAGRYTCTATNDFGWSKWDAWIKVAEKGTPVMPPSDDIRNVPSAPEAPVLVNATSTSITLKWNPGSYKGASPITGYILEYYCLQSDVSTWVRLDGLISSRIYTVRPLKPSSNYVFLVRAHNSHGISDPSEVSKTYDTLRQKNDVESELQKKISQISVRITAANPLSLATSSGGIHLEWESSANCDVIDGFKVLIQPVSIRSAAQRTETTSCYARNTELKNLQSRVVYEIRIRPFKEKVSGRLSPIMLASPESEGNPPPKPELSVDLNVGEKDALAAATFAWRRPESIMPEYITQYTLRCYDKSNARDSYDVTKEVNSSVTTLTLTDLPRGREYTASLTFSTVLGEGVPSEKEEFTVEASSAPTDGGIGAILKKPGVWAGIAACVVLVIAIIVGVVLYRKYKRNKKSRGLHGGRAGIPLDPFSGTRYSKGFTMSLTNPGGSGNFSSDGTGSSTGNANGNLFLQGGGMTAPPSVARNTTVSLTNSNGNVGTSLSPDMGETRPTARHTSSFSYVTDQLTSMTSIPPQFSSPNTTRTPTQVMGSVDLQLQLQQQQRYQRQASENPTILADEFSPQGNLIDMNTPIEDGHVEYLHRDHDLPPPPPSPPMSQKTSLSDRTNRSRGSSKNSAERGSNHSKGRRSRERNRGFQPLDRVATDTDTGIDSPQQTPSPPRPSDLRGDHQQITTSSQLRGPNAHPYAPKHNSKRRNDGIAVEYSRSGDPALGYLGGPSEGETESEIGCARTGRTNYLPRPEEVRNSVTQSAVSMMNRYDSESNCGSSEGTRSRSSSIESLNMESASQVGVNEPQHVMSPRSVHSAFVPIQAPNQIHPRPAFAKPKVPRKYHARKDEQAPEINGRFSEHQRANAQLAAPEQFLNRVNSASSSGSSSYHQNTADSGMSAGVGSYGHNSLNSSSSAESGKGQISRSRTTGSLSAESQQPVENGPAHFASVDRRYLPNPDTPEYQQPRGRLPAPHPRPGRQMVGKSPQRKDSQDSSLSLPVRDVSYVGYDQNGPTDRQPFLPGGEYRTNEDDLPHMNEGRTPFLAKSLGVKPRGRPELSDVPEASTSDFCEDYSDRSH